MKKKRHPRSNGDCPRGDFEIDGISSDVKMMEIGR
jgi:hypothetical protein